MLRVMQNLGWTRGLIAHAKLFWLLFLLPILPQRENRTEFAGMGEPFAADSLVATSGPVAFNAASPVTVTATIPLVLGSQPICRRGEWRLRITGVDANTTIGTVVITVDDGTLICVVENKPGLLAAQKAAQVDYKGRVAPIDNNNAFGGASDGMPTNIVNVKAIVAFATTTGAGNVIGDIALEWNGNP